ncbi:MAG: FecR domain-containing protein, partial [Cyclobacteriaceae bacterium]|nr:FecR domain-containing protein [Cyclobacteriaceae bacterium]
MMTKPESKIRVLLTRYANSESTEEEEKELFRLLEQPSSEAETKATLVSLIEDTNDFQRDEQRKNRIMSTVFGRMVTDRPKEASRNRVVRLERLAIAASVVLLISVGIFLFWHRSVLESPLNQVAFKENDLQPGSNKATLTLADGKQVVLDSLSAGKSLRQGASAIVNRPGHLAYNTENKSEEIAYNILTTPRGGQYQLTLADGSKVWLNAESSIRFPSHFIGKERRVQITGEVYFEVAKNAAMPFKVEVGEMEINVLGTHFNVNAYEVVKTTLIEGSVLVAMEDTKMVLKPGQQAQVITSGKIDLFESPDLNETLAWKNGLFQFNNADIQTVMMQVARWYDVEIIYEGNVTKRCGG